MLQAGKHSWPECRNRCTAVTGEHSFCSRTFVHSPPKTLNTTHRQAANGAASCCKQTHPTGPPTSTARPMQSCSRRFWPVARVSGPLQLWFWPLTYWQSTPMLCTQSPSLSSAVDDMTAEVTAVPGTGLSAPNPHSLYHTVDTNANRACTYDDLCTIDHARSSFQPLPHSPTQHQALRCQKDENPQFDTG